MSKRTHLIWVSILGFFALANLPFALMGNPLNIVVCIINSAQAYIAFRDYREAST